MARFTFDNFVARLRCPICDFLSAKDDSTFMQTHLRDTPTMAFLAVGDELKVEPADFVDRGYLLVRTPRAGEALDILQTWRCPSCLTWPQWAEVITSEDRIQSITPVSLTTESLGRAHYIEDEARDIVAAMTGRTYADIATDEVVPLILAGLQKES